MQSQDQQIINSFPVEAQPIPQLPHPTGLMPIRVLPGVPTPKKSSSQFVTIIYWIAIIALIYAVYCWYTERSKASSTTYYYF